MVNVKGKNIIVFWGYVVNLYLHNIVSKKHLQLYHIFGMRDWYTLWQQHIRTHTNTSKHKNCNHRNKNVFNIYIIWEIVHKGKLSNLYHILYMGRQIVIHLQLHIRRHTYTSNIQKNVINAITIFLNSYLH